MVTVSWQTGALKGHSVGETSQFIVRAMQWWQSLCGVRFGTLPFGVRTDITIYPYSGNMNGAFMGAYVATGQIIYTTRVEAAMPFPATAFAHEIGHCFGLMHVDRPGALMYWRGSQDHYFDTREAQGAWGRFGRYTGWHWPHSLKYHGDQIREHKAKWEIATSEWERFRKLRDAERDVAKRKRYDEQTRMWLARRRESHAKLAAANARWLTLKKDWDRIGGISVPRQSVAQAIHAIAGDDFAKSNYKGVCECFGSDNSMFMREKVNLVDVFNELKGV